MKSSTITRWARYYRAVALIAAWNGFLRFCYVFFGGAAASLGGLVDFKSLGWQSVIWTLLGTVLASVFGELFKHPFPVPAEPSAEPPVFPPAP